MRERTLIRLPLTRQRARTAAASQWFRVGRSFGPLLSGPSPSAVRPQKRRSNRSVQRSNCGIPATDTTAVSRRDTDGPGLAHRPDSDTRTQERCTSDRYVPGHVAPYEDRRGACPRWKSLGRGTLECFWCPGVKRTRSTSVVCARRRGRGPRSVRRWEPSESQTRATLVRAW